jgi:hypothetical protein
VERCVGQRCFLEYDLGGGVRREWLRAPARDVELRGVRAEPTRELGARGDIALALRL